MDRQFLLDVAGACRALADRQFPLSPPVTSPPPVVDLSTRRPFASTSPFNVPFNGQPVWTDLAAIHGRWWAQGGVCVDFSKPTDPLWMFDLAEYVDLSHRRDNPRSIFTAPARADLGLTGGTDKLLAIVFSDGSRLETWDTVINSGAVTAKRWALAPPGDYVNGSGCGGATNAGVRAANCSWIAGLITGRDIAAGKFDHALAVAANRTVLKDTPYPAPYVAPATAGDDGQGTWCVGPLKMGTRIGIPAGVVKPGGLSPIGSMMFDALQTYGAFVVDYTGADQSFTFYADLGTLPDEMHGADRWQNAAYRPLYADWEFGRSDDLVLAPLLRVANYQP